MFLLLLSGICETLKKMNVMSVLRDSDFHIVLGIMACSRSRDIYWQQCASSWLPYDSSMGDVPDVSSRIVSSTSCCHDGGEPIGNRALPTSLVLYVPGDLTHLPTIPAQGHQWLYAYHLQKVLDLEGP